MEAEQEEKSRKRRRARGSGSVYLVGRKYWIQYRGLDGTRHAESSGSHLKGVAETLLRSRVGDVDRGIPVNPKTGRITFADASKALLQTYEHEGRKSINEVRRRVNKHLAPFFGNRLMASITTTHVREFIAERQRRGIVTKKGVRRADVSNAEVNRELSVLRHMFGIAIKDGLLMHRPHIPKLAESDPRSGFFEPEQIASVIAHLPPALRPVIEFAYLSGWRTNSEILPLEWRNVDFDAGEVRLDAGTTKNGEGRVFPMTAAIRTLLEKQHAAHETLKKAGTIEPRVFFRMVASEPRGPKSPKPIKRFAKAWAAACVAAGSPGRIPHDLRRTAVRNLVRAGIPERVAMMMTGHKTRSVFERYNIVSGGDLREAARKLDLVGSVPSAPPRRKRAAK